MAELKKRKAFAKKKAIEDFKSFDDFQDAVETSTFAYFGKGFNFCMRQLFYHHPDLGIDLCSVEMDRHLIEREEAKAKEKGNKEKWDEHEKGEEYTSPLSP